MTRPVRCWCLGKGGPDREEAPSLSASLPQARGLQGLQAPKVSLQPVSRRAQAEASKAPHPDLTLLEEPQAIASSECRDNVLLSIPSPSDTAGSSGRRKKTETPDLNHRPVQQAAGPVGIWGTQCRWAGFLFIGQIGIESLLRPGSAPS